MRRVPVRQRGRVVRYAVVDDVDYPMVAVRKWTLHVQGYAVTKVDRDRYQYMHRLIAGVTERSQEVDHWDRNKLNNRRANLRICDHRRNSFNRPGRKTSTSRFKGVSWNTRESTWLVVIGVNYRLLRVGEFTDEIEAARAYDAAAREHFGEFAYLNFPDEEVK